MPQLTEEFVKNHVIAWLNKQRYKVLSVRTLAEHGEDIRAKSTGSGSYFTVECKGDRKTPDKPRYPVFVAGLGEILQRVKHERHYRYGLAFPESYRPLVFKHVPWVGCKRLRLEFLLVNDKGKVERITWKELKEQQTHKD